ncbi:MAG: hypothetical protein PVH80_11105 [Anaerolineae bacterium]|jgi:hypothetical protein
MSEHLVFVGTYAIQEGTYDAFDAANKEMADFVEANEPRLISWHTYVNEEGTEATTIMVHPDSESLEYHLQVAGSRIRKGVQMVQTKRIELYGEVSDRLLEQLRRISDMSGSWPVIVKSHLHGFPDWGAEA